MTIIMDKDVKAFGIYLLLHPMQLKDALQNKKKSGMSQTSPYEQNIKTLKILNNSPVLYNRISLVQSETDRGTTNNNIMGDPFSLNLAGEVFILDSNERIEWEVSYSDPESVAALHRFIWLQQIMTNEINANSNICYFNCFARNCIIDWINKFMPNNQIEDENTYHSEVWQTYSVAERVVCWINCLLKANAQKEIKGKAVFSIKAQLLFIANNLEYFGDVHTGNHLSNNGRALFIGGLVLNETLLAGVGLEILKKEAERIVLDDIFLREGSAHYQLLITRNYMEALNFAYSYKADEAAKVLEPIVQRLLTGCKFFLYINGEGKLDIPKIGDISPDCTPQELINGLVLKEALSNLYNDEKLYSQEGVYVRKDWCRLNIGNWILFSHVNHCCHPYLIGHTHQDTAGIVLLYRGNRVLIDTGRMRYLDEQHGGKGKDWYGHSCLSVDGRNPLVVTRGFYTRQFLDRRAGEAPRIFKEDGAVTIENYGFERLKGVGCHRRKLMLTTDEMKIIDEVDGIGFHEITLLFHTPHQVEQHKSGIVILCESDCSGREGFFLTLPEAGANYKVHVKDKIFGTASDEYGTEYGISSVEYKVNVKLPWKGTSSIKLI